MTDVHYPPAFAPGHHRPAGATARSRSFHSLPTHPGLWHTKSSLPLDIPGASRRRPSHHPYLLSVSASASADAVLSRSLLEECRLDSSGGPDCYTRPSLKQQHGRWTPSTFSEGPSAKTSLSTWASASAQSSGRALDCGSCSNTAGATSTVFTKKMATGKWPQRQTSALSVALRASHLEGATGHSQASNREEGESLSASDHQGHETKTLPPQQRTVDALKATPVQVVAVAHDAGAHSPAIPWASSVSSRREECPSLSDTASPTSFLAQMGWKRALLERQMEHMFAALAISHGNGDGGASTSFTPSSSASSRSVSVPGSTPPGKGLCGRGKRRPTRNDSDGGGDSDDDEKQGRPVSKRSKCKKPGTKMLACPFFKRNPQRYQRERSCVGPGWETMHRLKEHLYRCHALPIHCLRCHEVFPSEDAHRTHYLSDIQCQRRREGDPTENPLEGISPAQERQLRSRKRTTKAEQDKWRDAYRICFPDDRIMPSPYYEIPTLSESAASISSELAQYEEFVQAELPRRVRSELNEWLDREMVPLEERLRPRLVDMVRDIQLSLLEEFRTRELVTDAEPSARSKTHEASPPPPTQPDGAPETLASPIGHSTSVMTLFDSYSMDPNARPHPFTTSLISTSVLCSQDEASRISEYNEGYAPEIPFFDTWEMDQPQQSMFFTRDGEPVDMSWTGLGGDIGGSVSGAENWANACDDKAYFPLASLSGIGETGSFE